MKDSSFLWARIAAVSWAIAALPITGTSEASSIANSMVSPASADSSEPHLAQGADGTTVLSWLEHSAEGATLRYSVLTEGQWTAARTVAQGDKWFVNWADFPSVSPITSRLWAAHWLAKREGGTYAYDVVIALSQNAGETWGEPFTPHSDNTATEHGFVSLFPWQQGIGALWLDGRNMDEDGSGHSHGSESEAPKEETGMTLRAALIAPDQGAVTEYLVDGLVCDCCQTDVAIGPQGPIAVYRNRTSDEIRDIYVSRVVDNQWQQGRSVADDNWEIAGCPVNGPAIAASGDDVVVAWFTMADDTPRVRFARSSDQGITFLSAIDIDTGDVTGRVDLALLKDGRAAVSWLQEGVDHRGQLAIRLVSKHGQAGQIHSIATSSTARAAGFPQMVNSGDHLLFAWTETSGEKPTVRTARVEISNLGN